MTCYGLIPKDAPSDEAVPSGAGSEFSVEKVPGGFEVTKSKLASKDLGSISHPPGKYQVD